MLKADQSCCVVCCHTDSPSDTVQVLSGTAAKPLLASRSSQSTLCCVLCRAILPARPSCGRYGGRGPARRAEGCHGAQGNSGANIQALARAAAAGCGQALREEPHSRSRQGSGRIVCSGPNEAADAFLAADVASSSEEVLAEAILQETHGPGACLRCGSSSCGCLPLSDA